MSPKRVDTRAKFSGKRLLAETLGSALVSGVATYLVYNATCGDELCVGGAALALGTHLVVTPLTAWGIGSAMGGEGTLASTYLTGLSGGTLMLIQPFELAFALTVAAMPLTSALGYELSSNSWWNEHHGKLAVAPTGGNGGIAVASFRF